MRTLIGVEVMKVLRSQIYKKANIDNTQPQKQATTIWPDQENEFHTHIQKLINAFIWTATANKHSFEPSQ